MSRLAPASLTLVDAFGTSGTLAEARNGEAVAHTGKTEAGPGLNSGNTMACQADPKTSAFLTEKANVKGKKQVQPS